ncbi:hypothetical protein NBRC116602_09480 [Hyphomicrobiales bacterium 4NK60-0047b]
MFTIKSILNVGGVNEIYTTNISILLLSGCGAKREPIQHVGSIKANDNKVTGIDVYKKRRDAGEKTPDFRGDQFVTVRTVRYEEGGDQDFEKKLLVLNAN